jgi:hypothetical protein
MTRRYHASVTQKIGWRSRRRSRRVPPPDGRDRRDHDDPEDVQVPITRRKHAARGKHGHAGKVEVIEKHAPP